MPTISTIAPRISLTFGRLIKPKSTLSLKYFTAFFLVITLSSCVTNAPQIARITTLKSTSESPRVLLMPLDVELSLLTTGGVTEPKADWTESAIGFIHTSLAKKSSSLNFEIVDFNPSKLKNQEKLNQVQRLHSAVGGTILEQRLVPLPSKKNGFSYSLGSDAIILGESYEADYAMYMFVRDSYATSGRQALIAFSAIASAFVPVPVATGGVQAGYVSLVDLKTGEIVWFNSLATTAGDLRKQEVATKSVDQFMKGFPSNILGN